MALGGLAGSNCHCQWGLTGIFLGGFVVICAGIFTFFPVFLDWFDYSWYIVLCWAWFGLGAALLIMGLVIELLGCQKAKAREADEEKGQKGEDGLISAPTPYIMITG
mmetsp:Transcript_81804/g.175253  ORF Transcript_81804/g.175253 Transcript_81804/m.175253 type:complete len:107 (-) Transcript_81804:108-428(-)